jgi:nitronate monooxygenase
MSTKKNVGRAENFASDNGFEIPILMAPMAGASPPSLAVAVANNGGLGACGALLMSPEAIAKWVAEVRAGTNGAFQINLWVPDPAPVRDAVNEENICQFLNKWGPEVLPQAAEQPLQNFDDQCAAILSAGPAIISSIMGLYPAPFVSELKAQGIKWFANVTTVAEALEAEAAGADVLVAQGSEAGGHRGSFEASKAESQAVGLFSLLPAVVDAVAIPVVATGGIADARGVAAAMIMGASAVQIGTGLLRTPEANLVSAWADAIGSALPEDTLVTRAFSGRAGRSIRTAYLEAANSLDAPTPAPYPIQRALTQAMRDEGSKAGDISRIQAWSGQSGHLAKVMPAGDLIRQIWTDAKRMLSN